MYKLNDEKKGDSIKATWLIIIKYSIDGHKMLIEMLISFIDFIFDFVVVITVVFFSRSFKDNANHISRRRRKKNLVLQISIDKNDH